ncbi:hypothetical protein BZG36_01908 [Bifiguratus adelaidae]|uniref:Major facilitator superfamily (MFS) profile domain-containing protein n=1 Tax=Bifiguratus adelaidae TaxID=1938954 RepID=A0A261Y4N1_9FUNG|nr:hypothetical protein BZG36_01908 [Bifiguratus adelaidae]
MALTTVGAFQYGYHIGELNSPQRVISTCAQSTTIDRLAPCIPMTPAQYSLVVAMLTAGGLIGSLSASRFADTYGRRTTLLLNNVVLLVGSTMMAGSNTMWSFGLGRLLIGIGSGVITVVGPCYMNEIATERMRGPLGVLNQCGIVTGILVAQVAGLFWSTLAMWRWILVVGMVLAVAQCVGLVLSVESPRWLASRPGGFPDARAALQQLRGRTDVDLEIKNWRRWQNDVEEDVMEQGEDQRLMVGEHVDEDMDDEAAIASGSEPTDPLSHVPPPNAVRAADASHKALDLIQFVRDQAYRRPLIILLTLHLAQQLSGINAIMFYSTTIMSEIVTANPALITVYISIVNVLMTILSAGLIERAGRRGLFLFSSGGMAIVTTLLALGIHQDIPLLSAAAVLAFVACFAVGLGPVPFLIIAELVDTKAVSAASSLSLATNWSANFLVSAGFLMVRDVVGGAAVFMIFACLSAAAFMIGHRILPETKGRSVEEVIRSGWSLY